MAGKEKKFAKRYAKMLFNITGVDKAERAIHELSIINDLMVKSKEIKNFFLSPLFAEEERRKAIEGLSKRLGFSGEIGKFLVFLTQRRAVAALSAMIA